MKKQLYYLTPNSSVKRLIAIRRDGGWLEIYKGEFIIANEYWKDILLMSYPMEICDKPPVYKSKEVAIENPLNLVKVTT